MAISIPATHTLLESFITETRRDYKQYVTERVYAAQQDRESYYIDRVHELKEAFDKRTADLERDLVGANAMAMIREQQHNVLQKEFDEYKRENEKMAEDYMSIEIQMFEDRISALTHERDACRQLLDQVSTRMPDIGKAVVFEEIHFDNLKEFNFK